MEFYVSLEIFGSLYAIKANKVIKVYQHGISRDSFEKNQKYHTFPVDNATVEVLNPFIQFHYENGRNELEYIVLIENESGKQTGIPVNQIGELHLLDEKQIIAEPENSRQNRWFSSENQKIRIIDKL